MPIITIDKQPIDIDVREELERYDWQGAKWSSEKLIAGAPFRDERHPSFFVNLSTGVWGDSGAFDEHYASGNLAKLLAYLRNETYEESVEYLVTTYGLRELVEGERIKLPSVGVREAVGRVTLDESMLKPFQFRNGYLKNRAIEERIQRFMGVGYSKSAKAITLPWRHPDGTLANVKYRQIVGKTFWYERGGAPIGSLVYGIDKVYAKDWRTVVVCEAEIDAMSWLTCGVPAIALGGTAVTQQQLDIIRRSPIERLMKAMDNDGPGDKMGRLLDNGLTGYMSLTDVEIPVPHNDANDALLAGVNLRQLIA